MSDAVSVRGDSHLPPEPSTEAARRLTLEAGKYLGRSSGESIPTAELRVQAQAEGYSEGEIDRLLADAEVHSADQITIPEQGDLFGDLWKPSGVPESPEPTDGPESDSSVDNDVERFRQWCQDRVDSDAMKHSYSRRAANRRYARAKDVGRYFVDRYETFSTILITYCRPRAAEESVVEHAEQFYPRSVTSKRRRILKDVGAFDEYAGISILAPKRWPGAPEPDTRKETAVKTHAHDFLWVPGSVSESEFNFSRVVADDVDVDVRVETHTSDRVETPDCVAERGADIDATRGDTTALPQEVGRNLPLLKTQLDARGLPDYAEHWCAQMRLGSDDSIETRGLARIRTLGEFAPIADAWRWRRRIQTGASNGERLAVRAGLLGQTGRLR